SDGIRPPYPLTNIVEKKVVNLEDLFEAKESQLELNLRKSNFSALESYDKLLISQELDTEQTHIVLSVLTKAIDIFGQDIIRTEVPFLVFYKMSFEIESADVIRLIEQFLIENNLNNTLKSLQNETGITINSVSSIDILLSNILDGHWDIVLQTLKNIKLTNKSLLDLYEQIFLELLEMREISAARAILRQTDPMNLLKHTFPDRYIKLETLLSKTYFDPKEAYAEAITKIKRRGTIAAALEREVFSVAPSRLMILLGQSLKWQQTQGLLPPCTKIDLFRGCAVMPELSKESFPTQIGTSIKFALNTFAQILVFSPDGQYLVSGSSDGFIEIWNYMTGKLRNDIKYQAQENFMLMENPVTALSFTKDSKFLASGSQSGKIKIWRVFSGLCVNRLENAHDQCINCIMFSKDNKQLFTGSTDGLIRLHSLTSGNMLKQFCGHTSFVNSICYADDFHNLVSSSSDGTVKIWSIKNNDLINTIKGNLESKNVCPAINSVIILQSHPEEFIISNRSTNIFLLNKHGQVIKAFNSGCQGEGSEFIHATISPKGGWLYAITQSGQLYCLNLTSGKYEHNMKVHESQVYSVNVKIEVKERLISH
ncbi:hypothetical protein HZS_5866, partial [Henneguya salminicola]